ncbi:MAG TPA: hypothetical protein VFI73_01235 [Candidatus Nitrosopolaris sp.]|nr:hypothetical protein [Candidatus Nitrosopolaris sp.]
MIIQWRLDKGAKPIQDMSKQIKVFVGRDIKKLAEEANEFMKDISENK